MDSQLSRVLTVIANPSYSINQLSYVLTLYNVSSNINSYWTRHTIKHPSYDQPIDHRRDQPYPELRWLLTHGRTKHKHGEWVAQQTHKTCENKQNSSRTAGQNLGKTTNQNSSETCEILTQPWTRFNQQPVKISEQNSAKSTGKQPKQIGQFPAEQWIKTEFLTCIKTNENNLKLSSNLPNN